MSDGGNVVQATALRTGDVAMPISEGQGDWQLVVVRGGCFYLWHLNPAGKILYEVGFAPTTKKNPWKLAGSDDRLNFLRSLKASACRPEAFSEYRAWEDVREKFLAEVQPILDDVADK